MTSSTRSQRLRQATAARTEEVRAATEKLLTAVRGSAPDDIRGFVQHLADLRLRRGEIIGLRELRYCDSALIDDLDDRAAKAADAVSESTVEFLLREESLDPYRRRSKRSARRSPSISKTTEADETAQGLDQAGAELEMLIDIVGNLQIQDATQTTAIIENVSALYATLNGIRAELKNKRRELARVEGVAQFGAQLKLLEQSVVNFLDLCDTPEKCGEYLTKVMVQVEELEGTLRRVRRIHRATRPQARGDLRSVRGPQAGARRTAQPPRRQPAEIRRAHSRGHQATGSPSLEDINDDQRLFRRRSDGFEAPRHHRRSSATSATR